MIDFGIGYGADAVLKPKSVAIIGVSNKKEKTDVTGGTAVLGNLLRYGYTGNIYPVNPKYETVLGLKCYQSVKEIPEPADLAVIAVAAENVPGVLTDCAEEGCRAAVIVSSGFAEVRTEKGIALQNELVEICKAYGIRVLGPNNLGVYNVYDNIVASTSTSLFYYDHLLQGGIAWVTQSGALASTIHSRAADQNIGLSYVVTSGNECELQAADFIWYLADDPRVQVIGLYVEGIRDWRKFSQAADKARKQKKPVLVYKAGLTETGAAAVKAHTGSDAGNESEYYELFRENGVITVDSMDELYQSAYLLEQWGRYPQVSHFAIIAISGGEGGVLADGLTFLNMDVPRFSETTRHKIKEIIPYFGSEQNPVDVTAHMMREPEKIRRIAEVLEEAQEADAVIYSLTTVAKGSDMQVAADIAKVIRASRKPGLVCWYSSSINEDAVHFLRKQKIVVFTDNEAMFLALTRRKQFYEEVLMWDQTEEKQ